MSELGSHAAVGIESVEWLDENGPQFTVRVTGRWRRRRGWAGSEARGPTTLLIEADGHRHRFLAMPEPPSLAGVAPGTWRLSFSVPSMLAPGRAWLSLGSVTVPLAVPDALSMPAGEDPALAPPAQTDPRAGPALVPHDPGPPSLEIERAWRRADDAERAAVELSGRVEELERALADERRQRSEAAASLAERDRRRRRAEQRAHAEEAMRRDLAGQLAAGVQETARARQAMGELAGAESRIRELEQRLQAARRTVDEAERAAAAARAARERAERALAGHPDGPGPGDLPVAEPLAPVGPATEPEPEPERLALEAERDRLALEAELRGLRAASAERVPAEPSAAGPLPPAAAVALPESDVIRALPESDVVRALPEPDVVRALRHELGARVAAEAGLRARAVQAETRLAARVLLEQRTTAALRELRSELGGLKGALAAERALREAAEDEARTTRVELGAQRERSRGAYEAIGELRGALDRLAAGSEPPAEPAGGPPAVAVVTPERLSDALARLREGREPGAAEGDESEAPAAPPVTPTATPPPPASAASVLTAVDRPPAPPAVPARRPTLEPAVRRLAGRDAAQAGRLVVDLLGAQRAAYPHPIAYDVVLGPGHGCVQVTVGRDAATIELTGVARTREQVDLQLVGDPARLVRRLLAGRMRRLIPLGLARVRGRRDGLAALRALLGLPLDLTALSAAGMRLDPESLLALVAAMIDPAWTRGERFTIAHADERDQSVYLQIRDGQPPLVTRGVPEGRVATGLRGSAAELLASLAADPERAAAVLRRGDRGPLQLLREWVNRAQCG